MEEDKDEGIAAIIGALSAVHMQLQEVEETAFKRARIFREEAEASKRPTSVQYNTGWHLLRVIGTEVQELQEHIDHLVEFVRTGTAARPQSSDVFLREQPTRLEHVQVALRNAAASFEKASNALFVVGRALETEDLPLYADHLYNLSESVEAEANRARTALESSESKTVADQP